MSKQKVQFMSLGGVGEVGASAHLITIGGLNILLDCGMHPKHEGTSKLPDFALLNKPPDAIIISHAHVDHCGSLPYLMKMFPGVPAYCSKPTLQIMDRMLHNSVSVMTRIREEQGIEGYPLYYHEDADFAMRRTTGVGVNQPFVIIPGRDVRVTFNNAGHVLGSVGVCIQSSDHTLFYTGDVCMADQELMEGFQPPAHANNIDSLVIESTYGATDHADDILTHEETDRMAQAIADVIQNDGTVLIPCFALGRAQEILNILSRLQYEGQIPMVPIYASGMGRAIYEIYDRHWDSLKPDAALSPLSEFGKIGDFSRPEVVDDLLATPSIVVATSGMMIENTPSAVLAEQLVQETHHGIFFVGYCDPDTLGAKVKTAKVGDEHSFVLGADPVEIKLQNFQSFHFSAHAPRSDLVGLVDSIPSKNVLFVHGDPPALEWMKYNTPNGRKKFIPAIGESIVLS
jgi:Cft2 family RNA processing exonuclease